MKQANETAGEAQVTEMEGDEVASSDLVEMILLDPMVTAREPPQPAVQPEAVAAPGASERIDGVVIGSLVGFDAGGEPIVAFAGAPGDGPVPARSTIDLSEADVDRELALLFERGDPRKPLVMGRLHQRSAHPARAAIEIPREGSEVAADGRRLEFSAEEEIVLRCGKASITLTRAGKILIRGAYLLTRSSGVNRIQGGSVQIN
jgi:hypothetical protein